MSFEWSTDDRYLSNDGRGPMMARILCVADGKVDMERWHQKRPNGRRVRFSLPISFLAKPACGWKLSRAYRGVQP